MAITRALTASGKTGAQWSPDVDASANAAFSLVGGRLQSVAGTNTITATLTHPTGFTSYPDGFKCTLVPAVTNTGAVTLNIASVGAVSVRDQDGAVLAAGALVAGRAHPLIYDSSGGYFRFDGSAKPDTTVVTTGLFSKVAVFNSGASTWVTPKAGWYRIWVCGGGGSGAANNSAGSEKSGGGAAGLAMLLVYLASGVTLTYSVGAGGAGVATGNNGNAGVASSISGTGVSVTANGGTGGNQGFSGATSAPGGAATGGTFNITGQASPAVVTNNFYSSGGTISLMSTLATQAADTATAQNFWTVQAALVTAIGPFTSANAFAGSDGVAGTSATGGRGCGSGAGTVASAAGGNGFIVIEYEA